GYIPVTTYLQEYCEDWSTAFRLNPSIMAARYAKQVSSLI
ncbi:unnamed protein product, partial [marine sediment metagenome]